MTTTATSRRGVATTPATGALTGWPALVRLAVRADRFRLVVWSLAVAWVVVVSVRSFDGLYPDAAARQARAELMSSPAATALAGPGFGLEDYTTGAMTANELGLWVMIPVAVMAVLAVTRHLRAPEDDGRLELVRSQPVGRDAPVVAGLLAAAVSVLAVGGTTFVGLLATELDPAGSALLCAGVVVQALVFAGASAVASQLAGSARGASALAMGVVGAAFVLRAIGDVRGPQSTSALTWLSPFGWSQATAPYVLDRWWPLLVGLAATAALVGVAFALAARRDHGSGLLPQRLGPARGRLRGVVALTWRRQRTSILSWSAAIVLMGLLVGVLAQSVADFVAQETAVAHLFPTGPGDAVASALSLYVVVLAIAAAGYCGTAVAAVRADEESGRAAGLLALPVSREHWCGAQLGLAALVVVVTMSSAGLLMGLAAASSLDDAAWLGRLVGASLVQVPGVLVVLGVAAAVLGWLPRAFAVVWAYVAYTGVAAMFGEILPDGFDVLSPFAPLPPLPADAMRWPPVLLVLLVAVALVVLGLAGLRRRDLAA